MSSNHQPLELIERVLSTRHWKQFWLQMKTGGASGCPEVMQQAVKWLTLWFPKSFTLQLVYMGWIAAV